MNRYAELADWRAFRRGQDRQAFGFVPTLGGLHAGHRSLVERSVRENQETVVSLFLNPTQFDQAGDFDAYPAERERDLEQLAAWGVDHVLVPEPDAIYPDDYRYRVTENSLSQAWCGANRPGHFDGVLTVVLRLLNLVRPARAYFGEKDYQQLLLVRGLVEAFFLETEIIGCPTVREQDGLALSSRNARLNARERALAPSLHHTLVSSADAQSAHVRLEALGFDVDYVTDLSDRRLAAASLGAVRLIDNIALGTTGQGDAS